MERNKYLEAMFHTSGHGVWIDHRGNANATLGKDAGGNGRPHNLQRQWAVSGVDLGHSASLQHVVVQKALEQLATTEAAARGTPEQQHLVVRTSLEQREQAERHRRTLLHMAVRARLRQGACGRTW
jgi:hypothetical protein